jgi:molybdopterin converting factor small subunit
MRLFMVVSVHFLGHHRKLAKADKISVPLMKETRVDDLLLHLNEQYPELSLNDEDFFISVNDQMSGPDQILKADDKVAIVPHIGGG